MKNCTLALVITAATALAPMLNPIVSSAQAAEPMGQDAIEENIDSEFRAWCDRTLRGLERARFEASQLSIRGNFTGAVDRLMKGLELESYTYGEVNPITLNLIYYAHQLGTRLQGVSLGDLRVTKATVIALESFYDVIFRAADRIDYRYYECRSWRGRRSCSYNRTMEFEQNVLTAARDMVALVNNSLLVANNRQIFPIGSSDVYLSGAEVITGAASKELRSLIYAHAYSCEISDLEDIHQELRMFNQANQSEYAKRERLYQTYHDLEDILARIQGNYNCYRGR